MIFYVYTEINFWEIIIVIEWVMTFLEKITIFFWVFYGYSDFKTCKMIKIKFNKQIIDRCDSKIDFRVMYSIFLRAVEIMLEIGLESYDNYHKARILLPF